MPWPCTLENILGGIDITVSHIATERTHMGTDGQGLLDDLPAVETLLGGEGRIDSKDLMTGSFSLLLKNVEEGAPTGVQDAFCEQVVLDHVRDSQVFYRNMVILLGILLGHFEMMVTALTVNLQVRLGSILGGFAPPIAALLATAHLALLASQCSLRGAIKAGIVYRVAFAIGQERLQSHINANIRMRTRRGKMRRLRFGFTHDEGIPMSIGTQNEVNRLGCSL